MDRQCAALREQIADWDFLREAGNPSPKDTPENRATIDRLAADACRAP